jgi:YggT family protein
MSVTGTFFQAVVTLLDQIITLYIWVVIIAAVVTWVQADPYNPIVQVLRRLTEPVYDKIRRIMPTTISGIDFAPIILILALQFFKLFFIQLLYSLAA